MLRKPDPRPVKHKAEASPRRDSAPKMLKKTEPRPVKQMAEAPLPGASAAKILWKPGTLLNPVPAVMISCQRPGEKPNIITLGWVGTVCSAPPMVSISIRPQRYSHAIIAETREFVINLPTRKLVFATDFCGVKSGRNVDKFAALKLTPSPAAHVKAPLIKECPVNLECRVKRVLPLGSHDMFLAEVVGVHVEGDLLDETGKLELDRADLFAYNHGIYQGLGKPLGKFGFSVQRRATVGGKRVRVKPRKPQHLK